MRQFLEDIAQQLVAPQLIYLLQQLALAEIVRKLVNNLAAEAMEGVDGHVVGGLANDGLQTLAHIAGGVIGKSQTQYITGRGVGPLDNVGHAHTEQLRLPRPRPGHYQHRPLNGIDSLFLLRI